MGKYPLIKSACYSSLDSPVFNAFTVIHLQRQLQALWDSCYKEKDIIFKGEACLQRKMGCLLGRDGKADYKMLCLF